MASADLRYINVLNNNNNRHNFHLSSTKHLFQVQHKRISLADMQTKRKHFKSKCTLGADISTKDINIRLATSLTNKTAMSSSYTDLQDIFSTQSVITF